MGNAINAMVAGSDTTRAGLIALFYYLCRYPETRQKLYEEVQHIDELDLSAISSLPYLNAVVKETLRLVPPSPSVGSRLTGPDGLWVDDIWIPGGVKVNATKYVIQRRMRFDPLLL
jgi:cytochrome P450